MSDIKYILPCAIREAVNKLRKLGFSVKLATELPFWALIENPARTAGFKVHSVGRFQEVANTLIVGAESARPERPADEASERPLSSASVYVGQLQQLGFTVWETAHGWFLARGNRSWTFAKPDLVPFAWGAQDIADNAPEKTDNRDIFPSDCALHSRTLELLRELARLRKEPFWETLIGQRVFQLTSVGRLDTSAFNKGVERAREIGKKARGPKAEDLLLTTEELDVLIKAKLRETEGTGFASHHSFSIWPIVQRLVSWGLLVKEGPIPDAVPEGGEIFRLTDAGRKAIGLKPVEAPQTETQKLKPEEVLRLRLALTGALYSTKSARV